ncbi:alpha/beta hydrolase [Ulvibacter antarcticus]|uniref:Alpha/beta superfamily hydrolase n=1 Tax=Ulvibacter antarcticus TaxID=442714 RepID=A0A3L9YEB7_9FLAO|nr:alpha/beta hydrolase-fold protein [Ulvibacter antarcticus]RMA57797.1 hypothetical protein BXY75_2603 [Ulvibacter antarcticus]
MRRILALSILISVIITQSIFAQTQKVSIEKVPFAIGESVRFYSKILKENRILNIYLPISYSELSEKKYPVIYLLDGSAHEDFVHISGLVQFASFSWIDMITETIVVGISNIDRSRDFTYKSNNMQDKLEYPTAGESGNFIEFIEKELQPLVTSNYRVNDQNTLIGQSLGGLLATEILFKKPDLFNNYVIVSPSLWWDDESLLKYSLKENTSKKFIYLAVGKEGQPMERLAYRLKNKLETAKNTSSNLYFELLQQQNHGDALHLAVYHAFERMSYKEKKND